ncbi:MAG TPA: bL28 family ribosomal protein [Patescibacteria group bacterium]|nr:bL28 family ribosomal protein [Patescibacteria group bacterium]
MCEVCKKTDQRAISRSHSNIATLRKQKANLQSRKLDGRRILMCTRCIRNMAKETA